MKTKLLNPLKSNDSSIFKLNSTYNNLARVSPMILNLIKQFILCLFNNYYNFSLYYLIVIQVFTYRNYPRIYIRDYNYFILINLVIYLIAPALLKLKIDYDEYTKNKIQDNKT